jgi:hypothetical protein
LPGDSELAGPPRQPSQQALIHYLINRTAILHRMVLRAFLVDYTEILPFCDDPKAQLIELCLSSMRFNPHRFKLARPGRYVGATPMMLIRLGVPLFNAGGTTQPQQGINL